MRRHVAVVLTAGLVATVPLGGAAGRTPIPRRGNPLVWFAPLDAAPAYSGSLDYFKLFPRRAPWQRAAKHVDIFKIYLSLFRQPHPNVAALRPIVAGLKRRQIALAVEVQALQATATCGQGVEGFGGGAAEAELIGRWIERAGGTLRYVALDEPWYFGTVYDGPQACHFSADEVARQIAAFATGLRRVFPGVVIGDIEPLARDDDPSRIVRWLDDYRATTGSAFPFFHLDVGFWSRPGWPQAARSIEDAVRSRGIRFGFIYIGHGSTDREWTKTAENRLVTYEAKFDGRPDDVIFQSWLDRPDHVLPETKAGTFTWLINRYFRVRTTLALALDRDRLVGLLTAARPLAGARVTLTAKAVEGDGIFTRYALTGTAPRRATSAVVGFRVNDECGCSGASESRLYSVGYAEGGSRRNLVPNATFAAGLDGWAAWGDGSVALEPSDRAGSPSLLHVSAQPGQVADLNSTVFPITGGRHFRLTFDARVAPRSAGSGYFAIFFLRGREIERRTIALGPGTVSLGSYSTDRRGSFVATLPASATGQERFEAWFGGDRRYFPSYAGFVRP